MNIYTNVTVDRLISWKYSLSFRDSVTNRSATVTDAGEEERGVGVGGSCLLTKSTLSPVASTHTVLSQANPECFHLIHLRT